jgi:hypothetical protein
VALRKVIDFVRLKSVERCQEIGKGITHGAAQPKWREARWLATLELNPKHETRLEGCVEDVFAIMLHAWEMCLAVNAHIGYSIVHSV